ERSAAGEARANGLQEWARRENLRVAVHAGLRRRHARKRRLLDRCVAVAAVDAVAADMTLVAELDGRFARDVRLRHPGRSVDLVEKAEERRDREQRAEDADFRDRVGTAVEYLHEAPASGRATVHKAVPRRSPARAAISCIEHLGDPQSGMRGSYVS